ncbi:hypothetical protein AB5I41_01655 [Sphingomonas sp. MMS24-JH45]
MDADPEAAAILADLTANPICQTRHFETYAVTRAEWTSYVDPRVDELNAIYTRHLLVIDAAVAAHNCPALYDAFAAEPTVQQAVEAACAKAPQTAGRREGVMARLSEQHIGKCGLTGKCSVPMSAYGSAGFCDEPAWGEQYSEREPSRGQSGRYADPVGRCVIVTATIRRILRICVRPWRAVCAVLRMVAPLRTASGSSAMAMCGALSGRGSSTLPKASRASAIRKTRRKPIFFATRRQHDAHRSRSCGRILRKVAHRQDAGGSVRP